MLTKKTWLVYSLLVLISFPCLDAAQVMCFLQVPGLKGSAETPGFEGRMPLKFIRYRLPGVPDPQALLTEPPQSTRGMKGADDVESLLCSFSKVAEPSDKGLFQALAKKIRFTQWKLALCNSEGKIFMDFLFKGVVINSVTERSNMLYVTFTFNRVVWNYTALSTGAPVVSKNP